MAKTRSYQMSKGTVKLGSRVKEDTGPGAFITDSTLKDMMLEQKRAFLGGERTYGREYDNFYQDRRFQYPSGSREPTFLPASTQQKLQKVAKRIVDDAVAKGATVAPMAGLGTLTVTDARDLDEMSGFGLVDRQYSYDEQPDGPHRQFLTEEDFAVVGCTTDPRDLRGLGTVYEGLKKLSPLAIVAGVLLSALAGYGVYRFIKDRG